MGLQFCTANLTPSLNILRQSGLYYDNYKEHGLKRRSAQFWIFERGEQDACFFCKLLSTKAFFCLERTKVLRGGQNGLGEDTCATCKEHKELCFTPGY